MTDDILERLKSEISAPISGPVRMLPEAWIDEVIAEVRSLRIKCEMLQRLAGAVDVPVKTFDEIRREARNGAKSSG